MTSWLTQRYSIVAAVMIACTYQAPGFMFAWQAYAIVLVSPSTKILSNQREYVHSILVQENSGLCSLATVSTLNMLQITCHLYTMTSLHFNTSAMQTFERLKWHNYMNRNQLHFPLFLKRTRNKKQYIM